MRDDTRYGLPPAGDPFEPFPSEIPWDVPLSRMHWWLEIEQGSWSMRIGLRMLAAKHGWQLTLRDVLPRLKRAGKPPDRVVLLKDGAAQFRSDAPVPEHFVLLGSTARPLSGPA